MPSNIDYANNSWSSTGPPLVLRDLVSLQRMLDTTLPTDFVDFLHNVNGGIPSKPFFCLDDPVHDWDWVVGLFACTKNVQHSPISIQSMSSRLPGLLSAGAIPIGICASDGYLALRLARTRHHVWFYSVHEDRVIDLAPSFSAFLGRLKESAPDDAFQM
ncbi:MAG: SMI1/KNR4 family protein [Phycisphaerales bacterium]